MGSIGPISDDELDQIFAGLEETMPIALAVSGGADSVALMVLFSRWMARTGQAQKLGDGRPAAVVLTVDHRLRAASGAEAQWVGSVCERYGLHHHTLAWKGTKPARGIQSAARNERYRAMYDFGLNEVRSHAQQDAQSALGPRTVVCAHHADDQAETLLMRLARGSGVQGLAGTQRDVYLPMADGGRLRIVRPLLEIPKARLEATLEASSQDWIRDPSNCDERYERVRLRAAHDVLRELGLGNERLAQSAMRLSRARVAIEGATSHLMKACGLRTHGGAYAEFDLDPFAAAAEELAIQLLMRVMTAFGGRPDLPRLSVVEDLYRRIEPGTALTGAGCLVHVENGRVLIWRESGRHELECIPLEPGETRIWDLRFRCRLDDSSPTAVQIRALGEREFSRLRGDLPMNYGLPRGAGPGLPSFWAGEKLVAVPHLAPVLPQPAGMAHKMSTLVDVEFVPRGLKT